LILMSMFADIKTLGNIVGKLLLYSDDQESTLPECTTTECNQDMHVPHRDTPNPESRDLNF
jgi:hypothetical protein